MLSMNMNRFDPLPCGSLLDELYLSRVSFYTYTVLTFGDAQGEDEESSLPHIDHGFHSKLPPGILPHGLPTVKEVAPAVTPQEQKTKENDKKCESFD